MLMVEDQKRQVNSVGLRMGSIEQNKGGPIWIV